jgi:hypothetical protein
MTIVKSLFDIKKGKDHRNDGVTTMETTLFVDMRRTEDSEKAKHGKKSEYIALTRKRLRHSAEINSS